MEKSKLIKWLLFLLTCFGLVILLLCVFAVPYEANRTAEIFPEYAHFKIPVMVFLYITALPFYAGLYQAMKICREILQGNEFTHQNVTSLVRISQFAFSEVVLYFIGAVTLFVLNMLHPGILLLVLAIISVAAAIAIFSAVLSYIIKKAVLLREENEGTI